MNKLTYKEAYNMIIEAYFKDEIKIMNQRFCFCGTLAPDDKWRRSIDYPYTANQYNRMEAELFIPFMREDNHYILWNKDYTNPKYEELLFEGMCNALEELKKIHIERG